jgi:shikimate kinase
MTKRLKILLAGFSGGGKSSLVRELSQKDVDGLFKWGDLDQIIFNKYGKHASSLAELIVTVGWEQFRSWEAEELSAWTAQTNFGVLALGGGAFNISTWNQYQEQKEVQFCWLDVPFETCWQRLQEDMGTNRPLLALGREHFYKLYQERLPVYARIQWKLDGTQDLASLSQSFWMELSRYKL